MAFLELHINSRVLGMDTTVNVLLPGPEHLDGRPLPTLYLLHGLSDDHSAWMRYSRIERHAMPYRLAVVMPAVNRSFYMDMAHGAKYFTYVSQELPGDLEKLLPLSQKGSERFVAGLSMGGYGAMRLGLSMPERYAAVGALSAPLMMQESFEEPLDDPLFANDLRCIYGTEKALRGGDGNLCNLADRLLQSGNAIPRIYAACGTEDFLYSANEAFMDEYGDALGIEYHTEPGTHEWGFWDRHIQRVLAFLPLEKLG